MLFRSPATALGGSVSYQYLSRLSVATKITSVFALAASRAPRTSASFTLLPPSRLVLAAVLLSIHHVDALTVNSPPLPPSSLLTDPPRPLASFFLYLLHLLPAAAIVLSCAGAAALRVAKRKATLPDATPPLPSDDDSEYNQIGRAHV